MDRTRYSHITFKLKDNVYVAGGVAHASTEIYCPSEAGSWRSSCEQYSLKENKWLNCRHRLPHPLVRASVSVSTDESFAVITGGLSAKEYYDRKKPGSVEVEERAGDILIFTEDKGFKFLYNWVEDYDVHSGICLNLMSPGFQYAHGRADHVSITIE